MAVPRIVAALFSPAVFVTLAALLLAGWLTWDRTLDVWRTGAFFDTDDATRAVQLRTWLDGQNWYDLRIARMDPPQGVFMHWSRIVDVPLAAIVSVARVFLDATMAERLARLVFPAALLGALLLAAGSAAAAFGGPRARVTGVVLCFLGAPFFGQFVPGRIDHHAPQIVLLLLMAGSTLAAFEERGARRAAVAGGCAALSLSISLENLPFIVIVAMSFPIAFVFRGRHAKGAMLGFAATFAAALVVVFVSTIGPSRWFDAACDAYSVAHLSAGLAGCAALAGLALLSPRLRSTGSRCAAVAIAGSLPLLALIFFAPRCLGDPFVGLDPLVRDVWLHNVGEVEPLTSFVRTHFWSAVAMLIPMLCAAALAIAGAFRTQAAARDRNLLLAALLIVCLGMTVWGIRAFSSGLPLVAVVAAPWILRIADRFSSAPVTRTAALALAGLPFAPLPIALMAPADTTAAVSEGGTLACLTPDALSPVASLKPGTILAPIDSGAHLLALTPHAVLGAPYHRNNIGNRLVLDALLATPGNARAIVASSGADYVAICAGQEQARIVAARAPDGLAAQLLAGRAPGWLKPLDIAGPQRIFRVTASGDDPHRQ